MLRVAALPCMTDPLEQFPESPVSDSLHVSTVPGLRLSTTSGNEARLKSNSVSPIPPPTSPHHAFFLSMLGLRWVLIRHGFTERVAMKMSM